MSTIVYQEIQSSCNESYYFESKTLSLKLNSSKQCQTPSNSFVDISSKSEYGLRNTTSNLSSSNTSGGWSTIEALSSKKDGKEKEEGAVYVHPLVKRSAFKLSDKSLEMCTESLGNETGSCDTDSGLFLPSSTTTTMEVRKPQKMLEKIKKKKEALVVDHGKFPPPLTTISGSNHIHVKPYRENGRLVIKAVSMPPPIQSYMQAERSDGRLKLTMVRETPSDIDDDDDENDTCDNQTVDDDNDELESFVQDCEEEEEEEEEQQVSDVEEGDVKKECIGSKDDAYLVEENEMDGKKVEFGIKNLGLGKIQRLSRCKEGSQRNKRLINWEPFWVAT